MTHWIDRQVLDCSEPDRQFHLLARQNELCQYHFDHCQPYRWLLGTRPQHCSAMEDVPWLTARLFKRFDITSVDSNSVTRTITSSGTSGVQPSRAHLDMATANNQSRVLVKTLQTILGRPRRRVIFFEPKTPTFQNGLSARLAGVMGIGLFAREMIFLQTERGGWDWSIWESLCRESSSEECVFFGFTFSVWQFLQEMAEQGFQSDFSHSVLLHTGGWKKLERLAVSNSSFKSRVSATLGIERVHNFYGMAEQAGSVFPECVDGNLHCTAFNHVIVRNPSTLAPMQNGKNGVVQVFSAIPESYPGHSLLTEDQGYVIADDGCSCGWRGRYFRIIGRLPDAEVRGCSDVRA